MPRICMFDSVDGFVTLDPTKVTHIVEAPTHVSTSGEKPQILDRCTVFFVGGSSIVLKSALKSAQDSIFDITPKHDTSSLVQTRRGP